MSPVWTAAAVGALFGGGLVAFWVGITRPARTIVEVAGSLEYGTAPHAERGPEVWRSELARVRTRWGTELELCEQTPQQFLAGRLLLAVEFSLLPLLLWLGGKIGLLPQILGGQLAIFVAILAGFVGWWIGLVNLKSEVRKRRTEWSSGLAALVELIGLLVAGGSGLETATEDAARAGQTQVFRHLNAAITAAAARRESPWRSLRSLGERLGLDDLVAFSESMALAADGARVADALVARAGAVREQELNRELARAESMSESMVVPVALMLFGVFILIGFPIIVSMSTL